MLPTSRAVPAPPPATTGSPAADRARRAVLVACSTLLGASTVLPWVSVAVVGMPLPLPDQNLFSAHWPWTLIPAAMVLIALWGIRTALASPPATVGPAGVALALGAGGLGVWVLLRDHAFSSLATLAGSSSDVSIRLQTGAYLGLGAAAALLFWSLGASLLETPAVPTRWPLGPREPIGDHRALAAMRDEPSDPQGRAGTDQVGNGLAPSTGRGVFPAAIRSPEPPAPPLPGFPAAPHRSTQPGQAPGRPWPGAPGASPAPQGLPGAPGPGWHPDPWIPGGLRWWDGTSWTSHARPSVDLGPS